MEFMLIIAFLSMVWLLFKSEYLRSKRWFVWVSVVLMLGIIAFLVIDSTRPWNVKKTVLLILIVGSAVFALVKRGLSQTQKK